MPTPKLDDDALEFGERLRKLHAETGVAQWRVAVAMEISPEAYRYYLSGRSVPGLKRLPKMALGFGISPTQLFSALGLIDAVDQLSLPPLRSQRTNRLGKGWLRRP